MSSLTISGQWRNPAIRRCDCKRPYRNWRQAEKVAERRSLKTGELIIAYQCFDCSQFHIGHADESQRIVRQFPMKIPVQMVRKPLPLFCPRCSKPIPLKRREAAEKCGSATVYCSVKCREKLGRNRHAQRDASIPRMA